MILVIFEVRLGGGLEVSLPGRLAGSLKVSLMVSLAVSLRKYT